MQRVSQASVTVNGMDKRSIGKGLVVLLGVEHEDGPEDIVWLSKKIAGLRIFSDDEGRMNQDLVQVDGDIMVVSQFTLYASTRKGNRPSYMKAAAPGKAIPLYESFVGQMKADAGCELVTGDFGAHMEIELVNDGPVTIIIDTKTRE